MTKTEWEVNSSSLIKCYHYTHEFVNDRKKKGKLCRSWDDLEYSNHEESEDDFNNFITFTILISSSKPSYESVSENTYINDEVF